jgi:hypothetical protein
MNNIVNQYIIIIVIYIHTNLALIKKSSETWKMGSVDSIYKVMVVLLSVVTIIIVIITITTSPISVIASLSQRDNNTTTSSGQLGFHNEQLQQQSQSPLSVIENMREGRIGEINLTKTRTTGSNASYLLKTDYTSYVFSKDGSELTTPENNTHTDEFGNGIRIALIKPTFTAAAYNNAFYVFYKKYANVPAGVNITNDLNLLSSKVITNKMTGTINSVFAMLQLIKSLKWITQGSNIMILTDADVDNGSMIFNRTTKNNNNETNGTTNAYDIIILGHQEYVTQREYDNLKKFVANGGTMIILDGNVFYAEVKYDSQKSTVTLVKGHSWAFNGKSAWKSISERWAKETSQWVGSNSL